MLEWLNPAPPPGFTRWEVMERAAVQHAYYRVGNRKGAARWLGLGRETMRKKCQLYQIAQKPDTRGTRRQARGGDRFATMKPLALLEHLGVDVSGLRSRRKQGTPPLRFKSQPRENFWIRNEYRLREILADARRVYIAAMKQHHPDRGGDPARAAEMASIWKRILNLFAQHGVTP